jgi:four helix bundle protein
MHEFRRLNVWKRSHAHALAVRKATRTFPRTAYTQLKNQITSAAESIPSNIVEGCGAFSNKEFARFVEISIKSSLETEYRLQLAHDSGVLGGREWKALTAETIEIRKMLCGLRRRLLSDPE